MLAEADAEGSASEAATEADDAVCDAQYLGASRIRPRPQPATTRPIPSVPGIYDELMNDPKVVRIVALSGGYSRKEADELLKMNANLIASFSRALLSDLSAKQTQEEFDAVLLKTIMEIYEASI